MVTWAQVVVVFTKPDGSEFSKYAQWDFDAYPSDGCAPRTTTAAGDELVDHCSNQIVFDFDDAAGVWSVNSVLLADELRNQRSYYRTDLEAMGVGHDVEITKNNQDLIAPAFNGITITPASVDVSSGQQGVVFEIDASDASGISAYQILVNMDKPDGSFFQNSLSWRPEDLANGCNVTRTYADDIEYGSCRCE